MARKLGSCPFRKCHSDPVENLCNPAGLPDFSASLRARVKNGFPQERVAFPPGSSIRKSALTYQRETKKKGFLRGGCRSPAVLADLRPGRCRRSAAGKKLPRNGNLLFFPFLVKNFHSIPKIENCSSGRILNSPGIFPFLSFARGRDGRGCFHGRIQMEKSATTGKLFSFLNFSSSQASSVVFLALSSIFSFPRHSTPIRLAPSSFSRETGGGRNELERLPTFPRQKIPGWLSVLRERPVYTSAAALVCFSFRHDNSYTVGFGRIASRKIPENACRPPFASVRSLHFLKNTVSIRWTTTTAFFWK